MDAVPDKTVLDQDTPTLDVKVTNRTGTEAELFGWLDGELAQAKVPARSATVTLNWAAKAPGKTTLKLSIVAEGIEDTEVHEVVLKSSAYGYPSPSASVSASASVSVSPSPSRSKSKSPSPSSSVSASASVSASVSASPSRSKSKSPSPSASVSESATPSPSPSRELPVTGDAVRSYVVLGGGLLGFGLFILGLAWVLGRRSSTE
ncbi:MAG TPA: hypothetical protein DGT23_22370 [Micromonosporaceae bacterium]|nr:hypothetical protein [Micromonosporaceae bacterium]